MLAWRRRLSSELVMGDGQNSQDDGSHHEHEAQGDPEPVGDSPDGKHTLTEALTSRAHITFSIGRTTVRAEVVGSMANSSVCSTRKSGLRPTATRGSQGLNPSGYFYEYWRARGTPPP